MADQLSAFVRALRTFVQGLGAVALVAGWEAVYTAVQGGTYDPRLLTMAGVTAVSGAVVTYLFNKIAPVVGDPSSPSLEGLLRAARTLAQTVIAVGLVAGWDSVYATVTGGNYNPADIAKAAVVAAVMAVVSYLHNVVEGVKAKGSATA